MREQTRSGTAYLFDLLAALISHVIQGWIRRFNDVGPGDGDRRWSDRGRLRLSLPRVHPSILILEGFHLVLARDRVTLHPCGVRLLLAAALLGRPSTLHHVREITTRDERAGEKDDQYHGQESADRQPLHQPHLVQALAALPQAARSCRCFARIGGAVRGTRYMYTWCVRARVRVCVCWGRNFFFLSFLFFLEIFSNVQLVSSLLFYYSFSGICTWKIEKDLGIERNEGTHRLLRFQDSWFVFKMNGRVGLFIDTYKMSRFWGW